MHSPDSKKQGSKSKQYKSNTPTQKMAAGKTNFNVCAENKQRNHVEENNEEQHHKLNGDSKTLKYPLKNKPHFTIFDGCLVLLSLITYLVDTWTGRSNVYSQLQLDPLLSVLIVL